MTLNITDAELHEWAALRADDAGRLARELVACRQQSQAAVAAAYEAAAQTVDTLGDSAVTEALGARLCCDGHMCGCQGTDVGAYVMHHIRALATPDQIAALAAERAKLDKAVEALRFYANGENWMINGPLDGNSGNYTGGPAKTVLAEIGGA